MTLIQKHEQTEMITSNLAVVHLLKIMSSARKKFVLAHVRAPYELRSFGMHWLPF